MSPVSISDYDDDSISVTSSVSSSFGSSSYDHDDDPIQPPSINSKSQERAIWKDKGGKVVYTLHGNNNLKTSRTKKPHAEKNAVSSGLLGLVSFGFSSQVEVDQTSQKVREGTSRPSLTRRGSVPAKISDYSSMLSDDTSNKKTPRAINEMSQSCHTPSTTRSGRSSMDSSMKSKKINPTDCMPTQADFFISLHYKLQKFNFNQF